MPRRNVSRDLKARIPILYHDHGLKIKKICSLLGIKKTLVYDTIGHHRKYGLPYNPNHRNQGRQRLLTPTDLSFICGLLEQRHCIYLDEIQEQLLVRRGVKVSTPTLLRTLHRLHFSRKSVSARALERNNLLRSHFMNRIATEVPNPDMFMFVDEAAKNKRSSGRGMGWSLVGKRCVQRRCFVRGQRYSILPVLSLDGIITYDIIPGSVTSERFLQFLRELVVRPNSLCGL